MHASTAPSGHTHLAFNAPLSDAHAAGLLDTLQPLVGAHVVDLGCGWGEFLLRLLEVEPTATAAGVDTDGEAIERGRANASDRGLDDRVQLVEGDATAWSGEPADVVLAVGVSHAWGGPSQTLKAVRAHLKPGGIVLLGDQIWERTPTPQALDALGAREDECGTLGDLTDSAIACGYRPLALSTADLHEWDAFESRWCAGRERWLLAHPDAPDADEVRAVVDRHRNAWLHGYRGVLGFAYLTLAVV